MFCWGAVISGIPAQAARKNEEMGPPRTAGNRGCCTGCGQPPVRREDCEQGLSLVGLVGMIDPPPPRCKGSRGNLQASGNCPVMITGDHQATASAIAKELGILTGSSAAISGKELDNSAAAGAGEKNL